MYSIAASLVRFILLPFRNVLADPAEIVKVTIMKELRAKGGEFDGVEIDQQSIKLKPG